MFILSFVGDSPFIPYHNTKSKADIWVACHLRQDSTLLMWLQAINKFFKTVSNF
jgi:hypothetical protein